MTVWLMADAFGALMWSMTVPRKASSSRSMPLFRERATRVLDRIAEHRSLPQMIRVDHGPEFTSLALDAWAHARGVKLAFIQPGKPTQNAYIESFNGRFQDECLNDHRFLTLREARVLIEAWRKITI
jgi:putative transposase